VRRREEGSHAWRGHEVSDRHGGKGLPVRVKEHEVVQATVPAIAFEQGEGKQQFHDRQD
jgi:hypothetical protein